MVFGKNEGVFCRSGMVWPASFPRALLISGNDGLRLSAIERETDITKNKENNDAVSLFSLSHFQSLNMSFIAASMASFIHLYTNANISASN